MTSSNPSLEARRIAAVAGMSFAAVLVAGCSGTHGIKSAAAAPLPAPMGKEAEKADKAVAKAEGAVFKAPQSAAARAALGNAYLSAGRFVSAASAYDDAMALGDNSGRTALSLALAKIGMGHQREAVALLDDWRAEIPAGDLGLALALAGETSRGVAILADAVRGGDASPKLRQNLAYAYALDGRWSEAKLMAAQDIPAEQLDKRLAMWALSMLPDRNVERVATLIGAPVRAFDSGQPEALALKETPEEAQLAMEQAPALPAAVAAVPAQAQVAELAPVAPAPQPVIEANLAVQREQATPVRKAPSLAAAPARAQVVAAAQVAAKPARPRVLGVTTTLKTAATSSVSTKPVSIRGAANGSHFVQLGAFSSEQGARRAWGIYTRRDPGLAAYRMTITPASIKGKQIWRVAAGGLVGRTAATSLCSQLKANGGACFAYGPAVRSVPAKAAPVPGVPATGAAGLQHARR